MEDEVNFCCFRFMLYLSYSHGKATVAMCFGCIRNLYQNKVFSSQKLVILTNINLLGIAPIQIIRYGDPNLITCYYVT